MVFKTKGTFAAMATVVCENKPPPKSQVSSGTDCRGGDGAGAA